MQVTLIVWDDENEASILAMGFTIEEIEDVVYNQRNATRPSNDMDGSLQLCLTLPGLKHLGFSVQRPLPPVGSLTWSP